MRPVVGSISRLIIFSVVDLPQPDGPTRQTISPRLHVEVELVHRDRAVGVGLADALSRIIALRVRWIRRPRR